MIVKIGTERGSTNVYARTNAGDLPKYAVRLRDHLVHHDHLRSRNFDRLC